MESRQPLERTVNAENDQKGASGFMKWMYAKRESTSEVEKKHLEEIKKSIDAQLKKIKEDFHDIIGNMIENMKKDCDEVKMINRGVKEELKSAKREGRDPVALKSEDASQIMDVYQGLDKHTEEVDMCISRAEQLISDLDQIFYHKVKEGKLDQKDLDNATDDINRFIEYGRKTLAKTCYQYKDLCQSIYEEGSLGRNIDTSILFRELIDIPFKKVQENYYTIEDNMFKDYLKAVMIDHRVEEELKSAEREDRDPVALKSEDVLQIMDVYQGLDKHTKGVNMCISEVEQLIGKHNQIFSPKVQEGILDQKDLNNDTKRMEEFVDTIRNRIAHKYQRFKKFYQSTYERGTRATLKTPGRNIDTDIQYDAWKDGTLLEGGNLAEKDSTSGAASPG